jgi:hypothetical protein
MIKLQLRVWNSTARESTPIQSEALILFLGLLASVPFVLHSVPISELHFSQRNK